MVVIWDVTVHTHIYLYWCINVQYQYIWFQVPMWKLHAHAHSITMCLLQREYIKILILNCTVCAMCNWHIGPGFYFPSDFFFQKLQNKWFVPYMWTMPETSVLTLEKCLLECWKNIQYIFRGEHINLKHTYIYIDA
jgi:hypothetical protein